jgi:hypothetical protein
MSTIHETDSEQEQFKVDLAKGEKPPKGFLRGRTVALVCLVFVVFFGVLDVVSGVAGRNRDNRLLADKAVTMSSAVSETFVDIAGGTAQTFVGKTPSAIGSIHRYSKDLLVTRRNTGDYGLDKVKDLPGREVLEANIDQLTVSRAETPTGATITYTSKKPELVAELRRWAKAAAANRLQRGA